MSKLAIGEQLGNAADNYESAAVVAVFPIVDQGSGFAVDTDRYGARRVFSEEKLTFASTRRGAA